MLLRAGERLVLGVQHRTTSEPFPEPLGRRRAGRARWRDTIEAWRSWSRDAPELRGPVAGPGPPQRPGAAGAVLPADRRDRRRGRPPRCPRRSAASATGTTATPGCATPASPCEALWVAACPDEADRLLRLPGRQPAGQVARGRRPADHVRHRRRARPHRARARRTCAAGGTAGRCGSATAPGTSGRSTCTASCSAPPHRLADQLDRTIRTPTPGGEFLVACADTAAAALAGDRPGHLGGPRRAAALPLLQADVLGGARPGDRAGRHARRRRPGRRRGAPPRDEIRDGDPRPRAGATTRGAFTQSFGSADLDASNLMMPIVGLPARRRPPDAGHHRRHRRAAHRRARPGLPLPHRAAASTAWPARRAPSCCARSGWPRRWPLAGQVDRARAVFERAAAYVNDVGLLAEEVDPADGRAARQLPAGVQPHRPGQRRLGHRPGRGCTPG